MNDVIIDGIGGISSIDYSELSDYALMNRVDIKYVLSIHDLSRILPQLYFDYRVVTYDGSVSSLCANAYYDTSDLRSYRDHHNGRRRRNKIRIRSYLNTDLRFLEIKQRLNDQRTDKKRMLIGEPEMTFYDDECQAFVHAHLGDDLVLHQVLSNEFTRTTLVHKSRLERVTIDIDLSYAAEANQHNMGDLVIVEIKSEKKVSRQGIASLLKHQGIRPRSVSKYCTGISALRAGVKSNKFKSVQRVIADINNN